MSVRFRALSILFCAALASELHAQENGDEAAVAAASGVPNAAGFQQSGWRNQWGLGVIANPATVGSDNYNITPVPYLDFRYFDDKGTKYFANIPQGIGGYFYRSRDRESGRFFSAGMGIAPGFNVRDDSIPGLKDVGVAAETRLYLELGNRRWTASATVAQDVGSGHEGAYVDLSAAYRGRLEKLKGFYAVGPVVRFGDDTYKQSLFGISAEESAASGLSEFTADANFERVGLQGLLSLPLGDSKWRVTGILRASQLTGDAADSPLVNEKTQLFFLTAITRPF